MEKIEVIDTLLAEVCLDDRILNGTFQIDNTEHLIILREVAKNLYGQEFSDELYKTLTENRLREGNFPERQAYNKDGVLVTFPDSESKKAALERGSHFESDPTGGSEADDSGEDSEPEEESETPDMFSDFEKPEDSIKKDNTSLFFGDTPDEIRLRDDPEFEGEVHHVYDVLKNVKTAKDDDPTTNDVTPEGEVISGELHPSILFALKMKWEFDKSGNWYGEEGEFRASTDRRGQLDPANSEDKKELLIWLDDYMKKRKSQDE